MKESGVQWIGKIPNNWEIKKVKYLFYISKMKAHEKNPTILSLSRNGIKVRDITKNEGQIAESYEEYNPVKPKDLLLNPMDLYSGANCNMSEIEGVISPAYFNLRCLKENLNPKFYDYYFKTQYWGMAMFAHGKGVSFDNRWTMNSNAIKNYFVPYVEKEKQDEIVSEIKKNEDYINELINLQNEEIKKLKELKLSNIKDLLFDKKGNAEKVKSSLPWVGEITKEYKIIKLKYVCNLKTGITPSTTKQEYFVPEVLWFKPSDFTNDYIHISGQKISNFAIQDYGIKEFPIDTTLMIGIGGTAGKVAMIKEKGYSNQQITAIMAKDNVNKEYLFYVMLTASKYLKDNALYTTLAIINNEYLYNFKIPVPSIQKQEEIVTKINQKIILIDKEIENIYLKIKKLEEYKKAMIFEFVTGKRQIGEK